MAPMALRCLAAAGKHDHADAAARGRAWLHANEAVDPVTMEDAVAWCPETCRSAAPRARIVLAADASHLVVAESHPALRQAAVLERRHAAP